MQKDENINRLIEVIKQPVKNIRQEGSVTIIELEDGTTLPLIGGIFELRGYEVPKCNFCGKPGDEDYLYSPDNKNYICKECAVKAVETFASNGLPIDLNLSKIAPELAAKLLGDMEDKG